MQIYDANSWELYYGNRPPASWNSKGKKDHKRNEYTKKQKERRQAHNDYMIIQAKKRARELVENKSVLEDKMIEFLDHQDIHYEFQRVFYIKDINGYIQKYYIADFYLPLKEIIIETDGKFHDEREEEDSFRTKQINEHYPNVKVIRWRWHDFESYVKMKELIAKIK